MYLIGSALVLKAWAVAYERIASDDQSVATRQDLRSDPAALVGAAEMR